MKKIELIAKLEGAKELTSVVSIDLVLTALSMLEDEAPKGFSLKGSQFELLMDKIQESIDNIDRRELVDKDSAEFELDWNNVVSLNDISVDTDYIYNTIRESLEELIEEEDEDEDDLPQQILSSDEEAQAE